MRLTRKYLKNASKLAPSIDNTKLIWYNCHKKKEPIYIYKERMTAYEKANAWRLKNKITLI